jgi:hypothetical protein
MPRTGTGWRPGSKVIPAGWEAHNAPVPTGAMTAQCQIWRPPQPGTGTYDPATGVHTHDPHTLVWGPGPCRLQPLLFRPSSKDVGARQRFMRRYLVGLPLEVPPLLVGDRVTITSATDSEAVGLAARIESFPNTSLAWERDVIAQN